MHGQLETWRETEKGNNGLKCGFSGDTVVAGSVHPQPDVCTVHRFAAEGEQGMARPLGQEKKRGKKKKERDCSGASRLSSPGLHEQGGNAASVFLLCFA